MTTALMYCNKGLEDVCEKEAKSHVKCNCTVFSEIILCDVQGIEEVCSFAYKMQSVCRVGLYIGKIDNKIDYCEKWLSGIISDKKIAIKALGFLETNEKTKECAVKICKEIDNCGIKYSVDLKNPDVVIICFNSSDGVFIGIDFSGDLNKREYQVFTHNQALRPTISYSLLTMSGFFNEKNKIKKEEVVLLDPFCGAGGIIIEAALSKRKGIHEFDFDKLLFHKIIDKIKYDVSDASDKNEISRIVGYDINLNTITCARKNAKIAGINKDVEFSVVDAHFLDVKFDSKSVDYIVTHVPPLSKNTNEKKILKLWDEFLFISQDILRKKMVVLINKTDEFIELAKKYKFKILEERKIYQGETPFFVILLEK